MFFKLFFTWIIINIKIPVKNFHVAFFKWNIVFLFSYDERAEDEFDALFSSGLELTQRRNRGNVETHKGWVFCFSIFSLYIARSKFAYRLKRCSTLFENGEQPFVSIHLRVWHHTRKALSTKQDQQLLKIGRIELLIHMQV